MGTGASVDQRAYIYRPYEQVCREIETSSPVFLHRTFGNPLNPARQQVPRFARTGTAGAVATPREVVGTGGTRDCLRTSSSSSSSSAAPNAADSSEAKSRIRSTSLDRYEFDYYGASVQLPASKSVRKRSIIAQLEDCEYTVPIYGSTKNHFAFLEPEIFRHVLPFLLDVSLSTCLCVCPHWFYTIYAYLKRATAPVVERFVSSSCGTFLDYDCSTISIQPLFTAQAASVRIDLLLYATVRPQAVGKCTQISYQFEYLKKSHNQCAVSSQSRSNAASRSRANARPIGITATPEDPLTSTRLLEDDENDDEADTVAAVASGRIIAPPSSSFKRDRGGKHDIFESFFRFETIKRHASRKLWLQRDMCRFHGDELMIAAAANVPTVCVGDRLEIPVSLANGFGVVDCDSVQWRTPAPVPSPFREYGQHSEHELQEKKWLSLEKYQPTTPERLQTNDIFGPQWKLVHTEYAGIDVAISRSVYKAAAVGVVPESRRWLGLECAVRPAEQPVVCTLTRLGLQHDRFSRLQARIGDTIVLYVSQGGGIMI